jgi:hypothetical protein
VTTYTQNQQEFEVYITFNAMADMSTIQFIYHATGVGTLNNV